MKVYEFILMLLQRCHGSTAAEYEKYERAEIKIRTRSEDLRSVSTRVRSYRQSP